MSAQADWNRLVVDLRYNIFKLVCFAFDCSKPVVEENPPVVSDGSSSSDVSPRRKLPARKNVKRLSPRPRPSRSSTKRKKPSTSPLSEEAVPAVIVEDVNFKDMLY